MTDLPAPAPGQYIADFDRAVDSPQGPVDVLTVNLPEEESSPHYVRLSGQEPAADDMLTGNGWKRVSDWQPVPGETYQRALVERTA
ncbi:hypothetical protein ACIQWL_09005 [Streptomyces mirabilis]|uniref:hypothetical protein n=1 Tax=Streptomyces mirabilis TaxID=68239 RepID=UPI00382E9C8C